MVLRARSAGLSLVGAAAAALSLLPGLAPGQPLERWRQITGAWTAEPGNGPNCPGQLWLSLAGGRLGSIVDIDYLGAPSPFRVVAPNQISMESGQTYAIVDDGLVQVGKYGSCRFVRDPSVLIPGSSDPANPYPNEPWTRMSAGWTLVPEASDEPANCSPWMRISIGNGVWVYAIDRNDVFGSVRGRIGYFVWAPNQVYLSKFSTDTIQGDTLTRSSYGGKRCVYLRDPP